MVFWVSLAVFLILGLPILIHVWVRVGANAWFKTRAEYLRRNRNPTKGEG